MTGEDVDRDELLKAINAYLDLLNAMDTDALRKDELQEFIAKRMSVGERIELVDGVGVQLVAGPRRFNADLARKFFSPEELAAVSISTPSATLAHKLYPALSELSKVAGKPSVRRL